MTAFDIAVLALFLLIAALLAAALVLIVVLAVRLSKREKKEKKGGFRAWWQAHKPTKRRLIQVYTALLFNLNLRGFVTGNIFRGPLKYVCVPGLNCYSCPGAVGACPLGSLQNAFAASGTRAPVYVFGILLLYAILFARTVCGFLCPVGLGQELLYKVKTPKVRKSRFTRIFSYFKYVLLAVLVVAVPLAYAFGEQAVAIPAFCKYICPAGTFGGAIGLLLHPANANMFSVLRGLFTWKFALMVAIITACLFFYRFFCRFFCPLGALYGFFNKVALLGVKLDKDKCTECGLCVDFCKMDIRKVGDHECINCGECIPVCPAKAITWKGSALFVHENAVSAAEEAAPAAEPLKTKDEAPVPKKRPPRRIVIRSVAWGLAVLLFTGVLVYCNFLYEEDGGGVSSTYTLTVDSRSGRAELFTFTISEEGKEDLAPVRGEGSGTREDPYLVSTFAGVYEVPVNPDANGGTVSRSYRAVISKDTTFTVSGASEALSLTVTCGEDPVPVFDLAAGETTFTLRASGMTSSGVPYGNTAGTMCYDFATELYGGGGTFRLSEQRGKVVLVNFWYTTCTPCVAEMPHFARIAEEYADDVVVIAIHSAQLTTNPPTREGVQTWLDSTRLIGMELTWSASRVRFGQDTGSSMQASDIYNLLGGRNGAYPRTLVVDREGKISCVFPGSATYERLKEEVEKVR